MSVHKEPRQRPLTKDYAPPRGLPSATIVDQRGREALNRLRIRGQAPQANPLLTAYQVTAIVRLLARKGLLEQNDMDDLTYLTAFTQMEDLERLADAHHGSPILLPTSAPRASNGH